MWFTAVHSENCRELATFEHRHIEQADNPGSRESRKRLRRRCAPVHRHVGDGDRLAASQVGDELRAIIVQAVPTPIACHRAVMPVTLDHDRLAARLHFGIRNLRHAQVAAQRLGGDGHRLGRIGGVAELVLKTEPERLSSFGQNLRSDLDNGVQHAHDGAGLVENRAEAEVEVGLLGLAVTQKPEGLAFEAACFSGEGTMQARCDRLARFGPDLMKWLAQRIKLVAEQRAIGVVVQGQKLRSPCDHHREWACEHSGENAAQRRRPRRHGAELRLRPVVGADKRAHLPAVRQERTVFLVRLRFCH